MTIPSPESPNPAAGQPELQSIGVILIHGIGEQRRFEHLDWQARDIIRALAAAPDVKTTVEIGTDRGAEFHAEQNSWSDGPRGPVRVYVETAGQPSHCVHFHEVWWADVNERYSVAKQLQFWLWGLAIWAYPHDGGGPDNRLHGQLAVTSPRDPDLSAAVGRIWARTRLFMVGVFFMVAALPVGLGLALLQRVFNLRTPDLLKTVTNYVSGVKLFNQRSRYGPGFRIGRRTRTFSTRSTNRRAFPSAGG